MAMKPNVDHTSLSQGVAGPAAAIDVPIVQAYTGIEQLMTKGDMFDQDPLPQFESHGVPQQQQLRRQQQPFQQHQQQQ
jgi:hypothetical protein